MKIKDTKKVDKKETDLSTKTWNMVQEVATNEKKVNGQMLYICKNTFDIFKNGNMEIAPYFGEKVNNVDPANMFFNTDGSRKTLIAKDFDLFVTQCIIPALGQNLNDFQKNHPYEYAVLKQASPVVRFMICNHATYSTSVIVDPTEEQKAENVFRSSLFQNFFLKEEKGKDYYCTFRGERGLVEFVKQYFLPKKIVSENVKNAVESETFKAVQKMNDLEKGVFGTTHNLTVVSKEEQGKGGNMDQRLKNEVEQMTLTAEKVIDLFAKNKNPITQKALADLYFYIVDALNGENFEEYMKTKTKAKVEFNPMVNKTTFDTETGDFWKYVSQI